MPPDSTVIPACAQVGHRLLDRFGAFAAFEPLHHFVHFGVHRLAHFVAHLAHDAGQRARVLVLQSSHKRLVGQVVHAALFGVEHGDLADQAAQVGAVAARAAGSLVAGFGKGAEKDADTPAAIEAVVFVDRHVPLISGLLHRRVYWPDSHYDEESTIS